LQGGKGRDNMTHLFEQEIHQLLGFDGQWNDTSLTNGELKKH